MTIQQFIKINRTQIDKIVFEYYGKTPTNNTNRYEWILSDEGLYRWAHQEGVNI